MKFILVTLFLLIITAAVYAYDDGDFQVWNTDVAEIYYLLQSSKASPHWTDTNVLGTKVKMAF